MLGVVAKEHVHQTGVRGQLASHNAHRFVGNGDALGEHFLHGRCVAIVEGMDADVHCAGERLRKIQNVVIHRQESDTGLFQLDMTADRSRNYLKSLELFHGYICRIPQKKRGTALASHQLSRRVKR